jgi:hypothetical protein
MFIHGPCQCHAIITICTNPVSTSRRRRRQVSSCARLAVAHPHPRLLQGFWVRPWLLLALQNDPHFLYHMVSAAALTACVIGPALRSRPVSTTWRAASHTSLRLLHAATSLHSASLPGGVYRQYILSMLAQGGRWKVLASAAWCHGLLLQVGGPHLCACVTPCNMAACTTLLEGTLSCQDWLRRRICGC